MLAPALIAAVIAATPVATISTPTWSQTVTDDDVKNWYDYSGDDLQMLIQAAWTEGEAAERNVTVITGRDREQAELDPGALDRQRRVPRAHRPSRGPLQDPIKQQAAQSVTPDQVEAYVAANPRLDPEERQVKVLTTRSRAHANKR